MSKTVIGIIYLVIAVTCVVYGFLLRRGQSGSKFYLIWFVLGILLSVLAFLHLKQIELPKGLLIALRVSAIAAALFFIVIVCIIFSKFGSKPEKKIDYLIVAGAQVIGDGPSRVLKYRLDTAAEFLKENTETRCIVSGGKGSNESRAEADVMADYLISCGIERSRIIVENESTSTLENMEFSLKLFDPDGSRVGVVTSDFHLYRSLYLAKKSGIKEPEGLAAPSSAFYLPNNMLREFFCFVKDIILGL